MIKLLAAATIAGTLALAGCASDTADSATDSPGPTPTGPVTIAINDDQPQAVVVGYALEVITSGVTSIQSSEPNILVIEHPSEAETETPTKPRALAVGAGKATLSVYQGDSKLYEAKITVQQEPATASPRKHNDSLSLTLEKER